MFVDGFESVMIKESSKGKIVLIGSAAEEAKNDLKNKDWLSQEARDALKKYEANRETFPRNKNTLTQAANDTLRNFEASLAGQAANLKNIEPKMSIVQSKPSSYTLVQSKPTSYTPVILGALVGLGLYKHLNKKTDHLAEMKKQHHTKVEEKEDKKEESPKMHVHTPASALLV